MGSGKSTVAKFVAKKNFKVINKDSIRSLLNAGEYKFDKDFEPVIRNIESDILMELVCNGDNIVVDNTNLNPKQRERFIARGKKAGYKVVVMVMPVQDLSEAMQRKANNTFGVPIKKWAEVWKGMKEVFEFPEPKEGYDLLEVLGPGHLDECYHGKEKWWDAYRKDWEEGC